MSYPEDPDPRWRVIISDGCDSIVEWLGPRGYALMAFISALVAYRAYDTGRVGPLFDHLMSVEPWLFIMGVAFGGNLVIAIVLYGKDGDRS